VREKWIQIETAKIIRERLRWCYRVEGINHHVKCRHLVDQYLESTRGVGWGTDHRPAYLHGTAPIRTLLCLQAIIVSSSSLSDVVGRLLVRRAQEGGRSRGVARLLLLLMFL
jgi:hypothetical protein